MKRKRGPRGKTHAWWLNHVITVTLALRGGIANDNGLTLKQVAEMVKLERLYKSLGL